MKKYDYWIRSGKFTSVQKLATLLMGVLSFMILAHNLGSKSMGVFKVWALFSLISSITETARVSLIRNAFIRFINQTPEDEHASLQAAAFSLSLSISTILAILFLVLAGPISMWLHSPGLDVMLRWYSITIIISTVFAHCEMLLNAKTDFRGVCWIYCIRQGLLLATIAFCFMFRIGVTPGLLSFLYLLSLAVSGLIGLRLASPYLAWNFKECKKWIPKLWQFGKFVFGTNVSSTLFRSTDNFITANIYTTAVTSYYNACLRIGNLADLPSQVLGDILFPKVAKYNSGDKEAISRMFEKTVGATLTFSIPALLLLLLFPTLILKILAGSAFVQGASILRITAFFGFALPFLKQFGTVMDATGHPDINFKAMLFAFCLNIITNLVGVHFLGVIGAALGTATTYFILFIVTQRILNKKFGIKWINVFKNTFAFYPEFYKILKGMLANKGKMIFKPSKV